MKNMVKITKYDVAVLSIDEAEESVPVEETDFWMEMEKNRVGNLLAGTRLKAGLTQADVARKLGIRQNMVSDYERGKRPLSPSMAKRFSKVLKVKEERLIYRREQ
jgi:ribosome-binding protein aMBF1 (putative translation factor)